MNNQSNQRMTENGFSVSEDDSDFLVTTWQKNTDDSRVTIMQENLSNYFYVLFVSGDVTLRQESIPSLAKALKAVKAMTHQARTYNAR